MISGMGRGGGVTDSAMTLGVRWQHHIMSPQPEQWSTNRWSRARIPQLAEGRCLHIVEGRPWRKALQWFAEGDRGGRRPWHGASNYHDQDLLLVVLSTDPRMVVCLDVADGDAAEHGNRIMVRHEETVVFGHGLLFDAVKTRADINIQLYRQYRDAEASAIVEAVEHEHHLDTPWFTPGRWFLGHDIDF
jgi:hypothetical protein